jgi:CO/xanthine dehydrogenase FAD-binding subunit
MTMHSPRTLPEALDRLADEPDIEVLSGGTDMMVEVNFARRRPESVMSLRHVRELRSWSQDAVSGRVTIGASLPYKEMETGPLADLLPALAQAARTVGSPQIRAAGTIGGNLGTASPAGDSLPVLSALDATVHLASAAGSRDVAIGDFLVGPKRNALGAGELIVSVSMDPATAFQGFAKVGTRNAMVISVASACLVVSADSRSCALALGSVGPTVLRCTEAEVHFSSVAASLGPAASWDSAQKRRFAALAADAARPIDDHRSTAAYRRHAIGVLAGRLLERTGR